MFRWLAVASSKFKVQTRVAQAPRWHGYSRDEQFRREMHKITAYLFNFKL